MTAKNGGPFSADSLTATMRSNLGVGVDAELPDPLRFARGVAAVAKRRFRTVGEEAGDLPIIFLMHPAGPSEVLEGRGTRRVPMLDNGLSPIGGSLWFVNYAVTEGLALEATTDDDDATLFALIRETLGLGDVPAAILETRGGLFELRYFPQGLSASDRCETTDLSRTDVSVDEVFSAIRDIWLKNLCTPLAQTTNAGTWHDASKLIPNQHAEQRVQSVLKAGLSQRFKEFVIRQEQSQVSGRLDLEIEEPHSDDPSTVTRHAVLELKVLRAKTEGGVAVSPTAVNQAIADGLNQARAYRDERHVRLAALCCFDMRASPPIGDVAFDGVRGNAIAWDVHLGIWHLFNSSDAYRESTKPNSPVDPEGSQQ